MEILLALDFQFYKNSKNRDIVKVYFFYLKRNLS